MSSWRSQANICGTKGVVNVFVHVFCYRLKCLVRNKEQVFWTLLYPLLMATLFFFAFGHITLEYEQFSPIPVAVVESNAFRQDVTFQQVLNNLSQPGEKQLLELVVVPQAKAEELLASGDIDGIITVDETIRLTVSQLRQSQTDKLQSGLNQSILKAFLDEYAQNTMTVKRILAQNPAAQEQLIAQLNVKHSYTKQISYSDAEPNTMLNYFFSLIAMTCLYGAFWGLRNTTDVQADISDLGARRSVAPTHKLQTVVCEAAAALVVSFGEVLLLLVYLALPLRIDLGNQVGYILLTCFVGCLTGVAFGTYVGTFFRKSEGLKVAILIAVIMLLSFLSGLMYVNMRDIVARKLPFLSFVNPATLITDAFYSLYVYANHTRFFINIGLLSAIAVILCMASFVRLRREKYASL